MLSARHRFDNLRRIERLDPVADHDEIFRLVSYYEFPWEIVQGTSIAFLRDFGVPSIAALLDRTRQFEDHGQKRYDDTILIGYEAVVEGQESERGHAAMRHLNRIHGQYEIADHEFAYVLATTLVGPRRFIDRYGYRPMHPHEVQALTRTTTRFGELMGLKDLPTTYAGYERLHDEYERTHFSRCPASRRLAEASIRIVTDRSPRPLRPLVRRITIAMLDEPLRETLGLARQPAWLTTLLDRGLRLRARVVRFLPPRKDDDPYLHDPWRSYPHGYELSDLGPHGPRPT